ncbi:TIGR03943 family putative permease subunit [Ectobacillus panaciterrae]|uniref:TIGR03943 family putative permease subunit n=1 Tax=Ectobacillus panaciterrae TaxID=363872 RepID=UPI0003F74F8B|nr:TIGR03943 family protein [Ectobacillus panaciterrae]
MGQKETQSFHMYIRGIILIGFGMLLLKLLVTGHIENFIAPKMVKFIYFTFSVVTLLGIVQIWRSSEKEKSGCGCSDHDHSLPRTKKGSLLFYSLFLIPIVTAFLFSDHTIDASIAAKRGVNLAGGQLTQNAEEQPTQNAGRQPTQDAGGQPTQNAGRQPTQDAGGQPTQNAGGQPTQDAVNSTTTQSLTDTGGQSASAIQQSPGEYYDELQKKLMSMNTIHVDDDDYMPIMQMILANVEGFKGKNIVLTGFVHREKDFSQNEIFIARYGITCCVADASVWGILATGNGVSSLKDGEWVTATGVLDKTTEKNTLSPIIKAATIKKITPPKTPYVYAKF